jgi:hypothetical protein
LLSMPDMSSKHVNHRGLPIQIEAAYSKYSMLSSPSRARAR